MKIAAKINLLKTKIKALKEQITDCQEQIEAEQRKCPHTHSEPVITFFAPQFTCTECGEYTGRIPFSDPRYKALFPRGPESIWKK